MKFDKNKCVALKDDRTVTIGHILVGKLYQVNTEEHVSIATSTNPNLGTWHCRFGHLNFDHIDKLAKKGLVDGMTVSKDSLDQQCEACALGKMYRVPFQKGSSNRATRPLELIHSDVCGLMNVPSIRGSKYMLTFTEDFTRYITVYFITSKSEVLSKFKEFVNTSENKFGMQVKRLSIFNEAKESVVKLRSDNGGEYTSHEFANYCK